MVGDVGCGPGHVAAHLQAAGLRAVGVDLSPQMIATARRHFRGPEYAVGSMLDLPAGDGSWQGLVALYSIIHLTPDEIPRAFSEFRRVLASGSPVLVSFHAGDELRHVDELYGRSVALDFHLLRPADVAGGLERAGLAVEAVLERAPYTAIEAPTRRGYVLARAT